LTQHFFFLEKRKPVLKEKRKTAKISPVSFFFGGTLFLFFAKHFLSKERTCAKKETLFAKQKAFTKLLRKVLSKMLRGKYKFL